MQTIDSFYSFISEATYKAKEQVEKAILSFFSLFNLFLHRVWRGENIANKKVVVVLTATEDHNGALSVPHISTTIQLHALKEIEIIYKKVSSIEEIEETLAQIKKQNNKIKGLWLNAHGSSTGFALGACGQMVSNCSVEFKDETRLGRGNASKLRGALKMLDDDASIILGSCSTGRINSAGAPSIAQTIAELAPHRRIYAPTEDINGAGLQFAWDKEAITARFTAPYESHSTGFVKSVADFFYAFFHITSGGTYGKNITAVIKSFRPLPQAQAKPFFAQGPQQIQPIVHP